MSKLIRILFGIFLSLGTFGMFQDAWNLFAPAGTATWLALLCCIVFAVLIDVFLGRALATTQVDRHRQGDQDDQDECDEVSNVFAQYHAMTEVELSSYVVNGDLLMQKCVADEIRLRCNRDRDNEVMSDSQRKDFIDVLLGAIRASGSSVAWDWIWIAEGRGIEVRPLPFIAGAALAAAGATTPFLHSELIALLESDHIESRFAAAVAIMHGASPDVEDVLPGLIACLDSANDGLTQMSAEALATYGTWACTDEVTERLVRLLAKEEQRRGYRFWLRRLNCAPDTSTYYFYSSYHNALRAIC